MFNDSFLNYHQHVAALRSGDEPRPSLYKYNQNFKLKTFSISNKSRASPFLETAVVLCHGFGIFGLNSIKMRNLAWHLSLYTSSFPIIQLYVFG